MELAARAFDAITNRENIDEQARQLFPQITLQDFLCYWRKVLRVAALCHDLGHLPYSHAAEKELFPKGFTHESMTRMIVESDELTTIWRQMTPRPTPEDIIKVALGPKEANDLEFSDWEPLLAEIITGNSLGVDRIDYLLRDSYHLGVGYGKFDHFRLLETLRIVVPPPVAKPSQIQSELRLDDLASVEKSTEPALGLPFGGIHTAEALLLARYFMFAQVYFHPVRIAYDYHLQTFMKQWLTPELLPTEYNKHLALTDNEVNTAIREASADPSRSGHEAAKRIEKRKHFKLLRQFTPDELTQSPLLPSTLATELEKQFGEDRVHAYEYAEKKSPKRFAVRMKDGSSESSIAVSQILQSYPRLNVSFIMIDPDLKQLASQFLETSRHQ